MSTGVVAGSEDKNMLQIRWPSLSFPMGSLRVVSTKGSKAADELKVEVSNDGVNYTHWTTFSGMSSGTGQVTLEINTKAP